MASLFVAQVFCKNTVHGIFVLRKRHLAPGRAGEVLTKKADFIHALLCLTRWISFLELTWTCTRKVLIAAYQIIYCHYTNTEALVAAEVTTWSESCTRIKYISEARSSSVVSVRLFYVVDKISLTLLNQRASYWSMPEKSKISVCTMQTASLLLGLQPTVQAKSLFASYSL